MAKQAVLLLAHGTPETVEQIPEYLRNVVSGRPLPQTVVEEIQHRYALIGHSPLTEITLAQARLVEAELAAAGERGPGVCGDEKLAAVYSRSGAADARGRHRRGRGDLHGAAKLAHQRGALPARGGSRGGGLRIDFTEGWAQHPLLADAFAERLRPALAKLSAGSWRAVPVLFTAHSVPTRTVEAPAADAECRAKRLWPGQGVDPYAEEARHTAELVAARVPEIPRWWFAFQSQGASGGPWIGPSVEETLDRLAARGSEGTDSATHRVSLRPRRNSVRRGHPFPRIRHQSRHTTRASGVTERIDNAGASGRRSRRAGFAAIERCTQKQMICSRAGDSALDGSGDHQLVWFIVKLW